MKGDIMKTLEMLGELIKNPTKRFKSNYLDGIEVGELEAYIESNRLFFKRADEKHISGISLNRTWEEVKEPLTFMEILSEISNCNSEDVKRVQIKSEFLGDMPYMYLNDLLGHLSKRFGSKLISNILINSEWYIED